MLASPPRSANARRLAVPLILAAASVLCSTYPAVTREEMKPLLSTEETVLGQAFSYPTGAPAKVTSGIMTLQPGEETGWHIHDVPLFGYMLDGEITVDYGTRGTRVYRKGDALMEAIGTAHNGRNSGTGVARLLTVFMGAGNVPDTVMVEAPKAPQ